MMLPPPACRIAGTAALQQFQIPLTLTAIAASQSASAIASKRPPQGSVKRGVVDQRVDAPELPGCGADHVRGGVGAPDVEEDADCRPTLFLDEMHRCGTIVDVGGHDQRSSRREVAREFLPDPACGAGDQDDLATNGQFDCGIIHRLALQALVLVMAGVDLAMDARVKPAHD